MDSKDTLYYENIAVASIDILGFSTQVKNNLSEALKSIETIRKSSHKFKVGKVQKYDSFGNTTIPTPDVNPIKDSYGDSIYLYGNPEASIKDQIRILLVLTSHIIHDGVISKQYLARAGIATGNLLIKNDDHGEEIRIGTSIIKAHELEINQNWIGGAIMLDLVNAKAPYLEPGNKASLITNHTPPLRSRELNKYNNIFSINWLHTFVSAMQTNKLSNEKVIEYFQNSQQEIENEEIKTKYKHTIDFINFISRI